jgi:hypothetical protein
MLDRRPHPVKTVTEALDGEHGRVEPWLALLGGGKQSVQLRPVGVERGQDGLFHMLRPDVLKGG